MITLKVTEHRISSSELAIQLAEVLNNVQLLLEEVARYDKQVFIEETKLQKQEELYSRILERDYNLKNGLPLPQTKSRMDPMLTYDATALIDDIKKTKKRIAIFRSQSQTSKIKSEELRLQSKLLQVDIKKAIEREKLSK